ncbi:MAG: redoxin domain-containing protein, partial [Bacteroidia bacterium]|nr:redoxin domain-containing protein [Bacteroidia bacterium]
MKIGDKLINFKLQGTNGETYSNFTFADKYALCVVFTSNTCPYAQAYWNRILKLADRYEEDNLAVVAINSNDEAQNPQESMDNMKKLLVSFNHENFVYLKDETQELAKQFRAERTPEVFLFNSKRE